LADVTVSALNRVKTDDLFIARKQRKLLLLCAVAVAGFLVLIKVCFQAPLPVEERSIARLTHELEAGSSFADCRRRALWKPAPLPTNPMLRLQQRYKPPPPPSLANPDPPGTLGPAQGMWKRGVAWALLRISGLIISPSWRMGVPQAPIIRMPCNTAMVGG
jgi:hypothetical protein